VKIFLILIPLLSACAPMVNGSPSVKTNTTSSPFKVGQQWILDGDKSNLDSVSFNKVAFSIQTVDSGGEIVGTVAAFSEKQPNTITILNNSTEDSILLTDFTLFKIYGGKIHACLIPTPLGTGKSYTGLSAYFDSSKINIIPKFLSDLKLKSPNLSDKEVVSAIVQALSPDDNGNCTLTLVN
jgi:hypothetical protein